MGIKVTGARKLQQSLLAASGRFDKETIAVLRRGAVKVRRRQKELAPKGETRKLTKSISYRIRGTRNRRMADIGPRLGDMYPAYQEYGTARMEANPFVMPSLEGMADELADGLDALVGKVLR